MNVKSSARINSSPESNVNAFRHHSMGVELIAVVRLGGERERHSLLLFIYKNTKLQKNNDSTHIKRISHQVILLLVRCLNHFEIF